MIIEFMDESLHLIPSCHQQEMKIIKQTNYVLKVLTSDLDYYFSMSSTLRSLMECGVHCLKVNYKAEILIFFEQKFLRKRQLLDLNSVCCKWLAKEIMMFLNYFEVPSVFWPLKDVQFANILDFCSQHKKHSFDYTWANVKLQKRLRTVNIN